MSPMSQPVPAAPLSVTHANQSKQRKRFIEASTESLNDAPPIPCQYKVQPLPSQKVFSKSDQKLGALIQGYKTRRILADHQIVGKLRKEYSDLLKFAFGLQQELKSLD